MKKFSPCPWIKAFNYSFQAHTGVIAKGPFTEFLSYHRSLGWLSSIFYHPATLNADPN